MSTNESDAYESIDPRTRHALQESLSVLTPRGTPVTDPDRTLVDVVSHSGNAYRVDLREGKCSCPDHEHRDADCKHRRRARFALGREPIPQKTLVAVDVDENLGSNAPGPAITAADGGVVKDEGLAYSYHREPQKEGGAKYVRCEECGSESVPAEPERVLHDPECSEAAEGRGDEYEPVEIYGEEYTVTEVADRAQGVANMDPANLANIETELAGYVRGLEGPIEDAQDAGDEKRAVVLEGLHQSFLAAWQVARQS